MQTIFLEFQHENGALAANGSDTIFFIDGRWSWETTVFNIEERVSALRGGPFEGRYKKQKFVGFTYSQQPFHTGKGGAIHTMRDPKPPEWVKSKTRLCTPIAEPSIEGDVGDKICPECGKIADGENVCMNLDCSLFSRYIFSNEFGNESKVARHKRLVNPLVTSDPQVACSGVEVSQVNHSFLNFEEPCPRCSPQYYKGTHRKEVS